MLYTCLLIVQEDRHTHTKNRKRVKRKQRIDENAKQNKKKEQH